MLVYSTATVLSLLLCFFSQLYLEENVSSRELLKIEHSDLGKVLGKKREFTEKLFYTLAFLPLFLVSALRWNTGTDTWHTYTPEYIGLKWRLTDTISQADGNFLRLCYSEYFNNSLSGLPSADTKLSEVASEDIVSLYATFSEHTSTGFQLLQRILIALNAAPQWLYVVTSLIIISLIAIAIYRQSSNRWLSILLFVTTSNFFLSLNIISQFIAISFCLVSCEFAQKRKPIHFFALVALAAAFHSSAIVFLPVYFIGRLKIKPKWCFLIIPAVVCAAPIITPLAKQLVEALVPKYARYFSNTPEAEWLFFGIGMMVFGVSSYYYEKLKDKPYYTMWYYMNIIGLFALAFSSQIPEMKRINHYFVAPHFLLLPMLIEAEERPLVKKLLRWGIILFYLAETIVAVGILNKNGVLPYTAFWQESYESLEPFIETLEAIASASDVPAITG